MGTYDLVLKGGLAVLEDSVHQLDIGVNDGKIAALFCPDDTLSGRRTIDCSGKVILPGLLDPHSHITEQEDFSCGTMTDARGGITTVIEMPTSVVLPDVLDRRTFEERIKLARKEAYVDVALWGGLTAKNIDAIEEQIAAGCAALKGFLSYAGESYPMLDSYQIWTAMERIARAGGLVGLHAENQEICAALAAQYAAQKKGAIYHEKSRPTVAEAEAVRRAVFFAGQTGCPLYICHVSCPEALDEIETGRKQGIPVYAETCPHYLALDTGDLERCGGYAKCNPPLRRPEAKEQLWERLKAGEIDTIGSDHCCYPEEEKAGTIWEAGGGFPGADLLLPTMVSEGVHQRGLDWTTLARVTSTNAARIFGLYPQKGHIALGADADFAVVDPEARWTFRARDSYYRYKLDQYPYEGKTFRGSVEMTIVRGEVVFAGGQMQVEPGFSRFVPACRR